MTTPLRHKMMEDLQLQRLYLAGHWGGIHYRGCDDFPLVRPRDLQANRICQRYS